MTAKFKGLWNMKDVIVKNLCFNVVPLFLVMCASVSQSHSVSPKYVLLWKKAVKKVWKDGVITLYFIP